MLDGEGTASTQELEERVTVLTELTDHRTAGITTKDQSNLITIEKGTSSTRSHADVPVVARLIKPASVGKIWSETVGDSFLSVRSERIAEISGNYFDGFPDARGTRSEVSYLLEIDNVGWVGRADAEITKSIAQTVDGPVVTEVAATTNRFLFDAASRVGDTNRSSYSRFVSSTTATPEGGQVDVRTGERSPDGAFVTEPHLQGELVNDRVLSVGLTEWTEREQTGETVTVVTRPDDRDGDGVIGEDQRSVDLTVDWTVSSQFDLIGDSAGGASVDAGLDLTGYVNTNVDTDRTTVLSSPSQPGAGGEASVPQVTTFSSSVATDRNTEQFTAETGSDADHFSRVRLHATGLDETVYTQDEELAEAMIEDLAETEVTGSSWARSTFAIPGSRFDSVETTSRTELLDEPDHQIDRYSRTVESVTNGTIDVRSDRDEQTSIEADGTVTVRSTPFDQDEFSYDYTTAETSIGVVAKTTWTGPERDELHGHGVLAPDELGLHQGTTRISDVALRKALGSIDRPPHPAGGQAIEEFTRHAFSSDVVTEGSVKRRSLDKPDDQAPLVTTGRLVDPGDGTGPAYRYTTEGVRTVVEEEERFVHDYRSDVEVELDRAYQIEDPPEPPEASRYNGDGSSRINVLQVEFDRPDWRHSRYYERAIETGQEVGLPAGSFSGTRPVVSGTETSIDSTVTYGGDSIDREFDERTETRVKSLEGGDLSTFVVTELETFEFHRVDPLLAAGGDTSTPTQLTREMFASSYESTYDGTILDGLVNERSEYAYDAVSELSDQRLHVTEARYSITPGQTRRPTIQSRSFIFEATSIDIDAESGRYERATPERPIGETDNRRQLSTYDSTTSFAMGQAAGGSGSGLAGIDEFSSHQTDTVTFSELVALEEGQRFYELHDVRTGQAGSRLVDQGVAHVGPQGNSLTRSLDAESAQTYRSEEHVVGDVRVLIDSASIDSTDRRERQDEVSAPSPSGNGFVFQAIDLNDEIVTSGSSTFVRIQAATQNGHWADALRQDRRSGTITRSGIRRTQQSGGDQTGTEDYNEITVTSGPALPSRGSGNDYHGTTNLLVEWNGFIGTPLEIGTGTDANPSLTFTRFVVGPPEGADDARREDWTAVNGFGSGRDAGDWVVPWMDDFVSPPPPAGSGSDVKTGPDVDRTDWTWRPWWWEQAGGLPVAQLSDDQQRAEFDLETVTSWLLENSWVNVFDTDPANANGLPAAADGFAVEPADAPALGGSQTNGPGSSLTGLNGATAFGRGLLPPLSELGDVEHTCAVPDDDGNRRGQQRRSRRRVR